MYIFLTIIVLAIIPSTIVAFMARGITFQGPSTDNEVHAKSAALHKLQKWPSRIHNYSDRAAVKIFFVLIFELLIFNILQLQAKILPAIEDVGGFSDPGPRCGQNPAFK